MTDRPPEWALTLANKYLKEAPGDWPLVMVFAAGLASERSRCAGIIDAECEWGGDIREAERKVRAGEQERQIPGYNCQRG